MTARDQVRVFLTALVVYLAFWNPWLQNSMTANYVDAGVSFVDTGAWTLQHAQLYSGSDTAVIDGRVVAGVPPGAAFLVVPFYAAWTLVAGSVDSFAAFQRFAAFLALVLGAPASAFAAVQVGWLAGWLGASRRAQIASALLFAFGTQNFFFGTTFFKEPLVVVGLLLSLRLGLTPGGARRRFAAGLLGGAAAITAFPTSAIVAGVGLLVGWRHGVVAAAAFAAGLLPMALALVAYNASILGKPWLIAYFFIEGVSPGFPWPRLRVLWDLGAGPGNGLLFCWPLAALSVVGLGLAARRGHGAEAVLAVGATLMLWLAAASWLSAHWDRAFGNAALGPRHMFAGIALLAGFVGPAIDRVRARTVASFAIPSVCFGYLSAQAGAIPGAETLPYAIKTFVSGTGMGVLFKEALPAWLGFATLHTHVSQPGVTATDLLRLLPTPEGLTLLRNQAVMLALNVAVLAGAAGVIRRIWRAPVGLQLAPVI